MSRPRYTVQQQKSTLDAFLKHIEEGGKLRIEAAKEVGISIDQARKWMRKVYPDRASHIFRFNNGKAEKAPVVYVTPQKKQPEMITIPLSVPHEDDPKKRMALSLLDNVEQILKTVREILG